MQDLDAFDLNGGRAGHGGLKRGGRGVEERVRPGFSAAREKLTRQEADPSSARHAGYRLRIGRGDNSGLEDRREERLGTLPASQEARLGERPTFAGHAGRIAPSIGRSKRRGVRPPVSPSRVASPRRDDSPKRPLPAGERGG